MPRVLLIDDDPSASELLRVAMEEQGYDFEVAFSAAEGLALSLEKSPVLILLANRLPDQTGLDVFRVLRSRARTMYIPVMFLAGRNEAAHQNEILQAGADDFILKPFDVDILGLRIRNAIQRTERDGLHHPLSGLPTGRLIQERIRALADEYGWYKIDFDIENFGAFRESYGFMTGQEVINFAAGLIHDLVQAEGTPDDFIGQRADTEFVIITALANGPDLRLALESRFNEGILSFYNFMEREQGYLLVNNQSGEAVQMPLMRARLKVQEGEPED